MRKTLARILLATTLASTAAGCRKYANDGAAEEALPQGRVSAEHKETSVDKAAEPATMAKSEAGGEGNTEAYKDYGVNRATNTAQDRLSTFAIDVDTASYSIARRKLLEGTLPPVAAVRVEEFINYFRYGYAEPTQGAFAVHIDGAPSPFSPGKHILRIGLQADRLTASERKRANLVFLVDVSGSMSDDDKLPLAQASLRTMLTGLREDDMVSIVTYAGGTEVILPATPVSETQRIQSAINGLSSGGSTAMGDGLALAYAEAAKGLSAETISRVIVLSDGDANVGATGYQEILARLDGYVKEGVTLSTIGFGTGNYKDTMMEQLADRGNGNYYYIDDREQADRVFRDQLIGMMQVVAKDVKVQIEMIPEAVASYRLIGYENRDVADESFRDDHVDGGEIGAGHTVTALYEVELTSAPGPIARVRLRAKPPTGNTATETEAVITRDQIASRFEAASDDFRFAIAAMATAEILRQSPYAKDWTLASVRDIAQASAGTAGERTELVRLIARAIELSRAGS